MRSLYRTTLFVVLVCSSFILSAQEQSKTTTTTNGVQPEVNPSQKAQNNNTVRSNRTESKAAIGQSEAQNGNNSANSKKGYDYYKAQSDLNSTKSQDHNSSRSNKTSQSNVNIDNAGTEKKDFNQNSSRENNPK
jgi:hypothetical protein